MYSENGVLVDFEEICKVIDSADVFILGFANFPERLLVDARTNETEGPLIKVVEPARGARERLAWLRRRRPSLGTPQSFSFLAWPHSPGFLAASEVWTAILRRIGADSDVEAQAQAEQAMKELRNLDLAASMAVLNGENTYDLYPRQPSREERA
jgi:hypothetical protein